MHILNQVFQKGKTEEENAEGEADDYSSELLCVKAHLNFQSAKQTLNSYQPTDLPPHSQSKTKLPSFTNINIHTLTFPVHKGTTDVDDITDVVILSGIVSIGLCQGGQVIVVACFGVGVGAVHYSMGRTGKGCGPHKGVGTVLQLTQKLRPIPCHLLGMVTHKGDDGFAGVFSMAFLLAPVIDQGQLSSIIDQLGVGFTCVHKN